MVGSSVNPHYTFNYSQPDEYHFSHDSVFLARRVFELLKNEDLGSLSALDLCAGCGIVGLDFLFHLAQEDRKIPKQFDFLEVQEVYRSHFNKNLESLDARNIHIKYLEKNYEILLTPDYSSRYDLIVSNPPYFETQEGTLSPSSFKNRCRFFIDSSSDKLLQGIANSLTDQGRAFILSRRNIPSQESLKVQIVEEIRGTPLYLFTPIR